ncbi:BrnT family toxin [Novosphingobium sp. KACC 22771]|uniref:BrnT family toxin n=1 Tax=Novosphingobium sp. KACC 22771 TaxID=3025670 RepID=UPI0023651A90|nr:BrnT family toxin [Novosphingobium sp. KACC 22771]WDF71473.1 BrnT family toxin [Novosphingobium sp. KACC 22771]
MRKNLASVNRYYNLRLTPIQIVTTENPMMIVWDEPKREANILKHGIDFADIGEGFFASALIGQAKAGRWFAIGEMDGVIVVIFATLGTEGISIISARPASRKERKLIA